MTDPECVNYDFCSTLEDVNAEFEIFTFRENNPFENGEIIRIENPITDTTYPGRLYFRALSGDATKYDWTVGADPRFIDTREWDLAFPAATGNVEIGLFVEREVSRCPDKGVETASTSRNMFVLPNRFDYQVPYLGKYLGNNEGEPDSANFEIEFFISNPQEGFVSIRNFPRNALNRGDLDNLGIVANYKSFIIAPTINVCCRRTHGTGVFSDDRSELRIEYSSFDFDREEWVKDIWKGRRVE